MKTDSVNEVLPTNLVNMHWREEALRNRALTLIAGDEKSRLHFAVIEAAMDIADALRELETSEQDLKVIQLFSVRIFNAFSASIKLAMSGYNQNAALILRDVLETVFLLDYFASNKDMITRWRNADDTTRQREFRPIKVREALDGRDGNTSNMRHEMYKMFSILAGHPNMNSILMLRPVRGGDAIIGPFVEITGLQATIAEMGRLAVQVGAHLECFFPPDRDIARVVRRHFAGLAQFWWQTFFPSKKSSPRSGSAFGNP